MQVHPPHVRSSVGPVRQSGQSGKAKLSEAANDEALPILAHCARQEGHGSVQFQPVLDWTRFSRFRFGRFGRFLFHIDSGSWILQVDIQTKVLHLQE